jgi:hypothetical protein
MISKIKSGSKNRFGYRASNLRIFPLSNSSLDIRRSCVTSVHSSTTRQGKTSYTRSKAVFVGEATHRFYEAIFLDSIPIVKRRRHHAKRTDLSSLIRIFFGKVENKGLIS